MKLLDTSLKIKNEFSRLMDQYHEYYWASAWATLKSLNSHKLISNKNKIKRLLIGLHFCKTDPEFIIKLKDLPEVKFLTKKQGIFHPKLYLFQNNSEDWEIIIGSANFTNAAFENNSEICILIKSTDENSNIIYEQAKKYINSIWNNTDYNYKLTWTEEEILDYSSKWRKQNNISARLEGKYTNTIGKPLPRVQIMNLEWNEYIRKIKQEETHDLGMRLKVLRKAKEYFTAHEHFKDMELNQRKAIAGFLGKNIDNMDWGYFGSMMGSGKFKNWIIENNISISLALDQIPLVEDINERHFKNFIKHFKKVVDSDTWIATSSRLLAMKRPDVFVCFDIKNKTKLCKDFGIPAYNMTYERYWKEIIQRIIDSNWWIVKKPTDELELEIWEGRSAFLDSIYYEADK